MRERSLDPRELRRRLGALLVARVRALEAASYPIDEAVVVDQVTHLARYWLDLREIVELDGQVTRRLEGVCDALDYLEIRPEWARADPPRVFEIDPSLYTGIGEVESRRAPVESSDEPSVHIGVDRAVEGGDRQLVTVYTAAGDLVGVYPATLERLDVDEEGS